MVEGDLVLPRPQPAPSAPATRAPDSAAAAGTDSGPALSAAELVALGKEGGGGAGEGAEEGVGLGQEAEGAAGEGGEGLEEGKGGEEQHAEATADGEQAPGQAQAVRPGAQDGQSGSGSGSAGAGASGAGKSSRTRTSAARLETVHVVSAREAAEGCFNIEDVVLPLPGIRVQVSVLIRPPAKQETICQFQHEEEEHVGQEGRRLTKFGLLPERLEEIVLVPAFQKRGPPTSLPAEG